jgi:ABC-type dipeptide/oligopeptide/nickel transport system permease subunit
MLKVINNTLDNKSIKLFLTLVTGVLAGYTLQPVPEWLNNLFNTSNLLKFIILVIISFTILHPLDEDKLKLSIISSFIILFLFEKMRK